MSKFETWTDWIDYSISYRKYSEEHEKYLEEYGKYKEYCEKYGKSEAVKEPKKPQKPECPTNSWHKSDYTYCCNFYNNSGRTR